MNTLWLLAATLLPYFSSLLLLDVPRNPIALQLYFTNLLYFALCICIWQVSLACAELFTREKSDAFTVKKGAMLVLLLGSTLLSLTFLQIMKERFSKPFFLLTLALIAASGLSAFFIKKARPFFALVVLFVYDVMVAYATFIFIETAFSWPVLIFAAGIAGQTAAYRAARQLSGLSMRHFNFLSGENASARAERQQTLVGRFYLLMLISGTISIGVLALIGMLSPFYFGAYVLLPLIARLADEFRQNPHTVQNIEDFMPRNTRILLFIAVIIPTISLLLATV